MIGRIVLAALLAAMLAGCAAAPPTPGVADRGATATGDQDAPRFIGLVGTREQHAPPFLGVPQTNFYCLRSFVDRRTGETEHQLYVSDSYSGAERHWNAAHDSAGRPLRLVEISRHEIACTDGGCSYAEEFAATIPERDLRGNPRGLTVTFTAASGAEKRITVSPAQISAQFAALDRSRTPAQPAAARAQPAVAPDTTNTPSGPR